MKALTTEEKGQELVKFLQGKESKFAVFGQPKVVVQPLIKKGLIHSDTFKYTGGATLTEKGRTFIHTSKA